MASTSIDYRVELFRLRLPAYKIAAQINHHPARLSAFLNGRAAMPDSVAQKLDMIIAERERELAQEAGQR
jgi:hypothetical protein